MADTAADHRGRRDRLRALLSDHDGFDRLVVTSLPNVRYLTGFTGSNAVVVIDADPAGDVFGTDGRYVDQAAEQVADLLMIIDRDTLPAVLERIRTGRYAIESTLAIGEANSVAARFPGLVVADGLVEDLRVTKDAGELALLERACTVTVAAMHALAGEIRVGDSELRVARRLEQLFGELGAEDRAFGTIVASGPNSAIPHHEPGGRALSRGDLLVIDAGARVEGYHADMTRTFVVGAEPDEWQVQVHALVQAAQQQAVRAVRSGMAGRDVDTVARRVIEASEHADRFTHGLGHGVGLEIHEAPSLGARSTSTLGTDMAITVEPGVYVPGRGGVRIEDTLVVTDAGSRTLTEASRDLVVVG